MPFIFEVLNKALRKFPIFNAQVAGDQIIYKQDINLGMAVALDWGLIVPVIKRADDLSISGLARAANDLADRARTRQLKRSEEHTSELQSQSNLVCRLLLEKKKKKK